MYSYEHDPETGGIILTPSPTNFSKEPRPVYAPELDMLGFSRFWKYSHQTDAPYMWAESNAYFYRGKKVAEIRGGDLYNAPEVILTPDGEALTCELEPVDIDGMCRKNKMLLKTVERRAVKGIANVYQQFRGKADIFHVAFSGGKDSAVLLDLVKKTLPRKNFVVVFGNTGMEFPDTYRAVDEAERICVREGIRFFRASSCFEPGESWRLFGPPSRTLRWCCGVHKNAPQILKLREICEKKNLTAFAFVGVRAEESIARSKYKYLNFGKELGGQYSHNSILDWTSAEVWLYIYLHRLYVNEAYKKGMGRVGCLMCPMGGGKKNDYCQMSAYPEGVSALAEIVMSMNERCKGNSKALREYICKGGWNARKNGRDIKRDKSRQYLEDIEGGMFIIRVINPASNWREWIKTLGDIPFVFRYTKLDDGYEIRCNIAVKRKHMVLFKKFRYIFKKSAYCLSCRVCEANCPHGCISFENGLTISNCKHCGLCLELEEGCLAYRSLRMPYEGVVEMNGRSVNQFSNHAPKPEWIRDFFSVGNGYWDNNSLGPEQLRRFRLFLRLSGLMDKHNSTTKLFDGILKSYKWDSDITWGIIITNLAYQSNQVEWYIENMTAGKQYTRSVISEMLEAEGLKKDGISSVISAFKRLCELPLGKVLKFGYVEDDGRQASVLCRNECNITDNRVLLYALYVFAEKCSIGHEFSLAYLFDDTIERAGVSPVKIFGLHDDEQSRGIRARLTGLSAAYPQFINATFTHDMQTITLMDKTPDEVLELFRKDE